MRPFMALSPPRSCCGFNASHHGLRRSGGFLEDRQQVTLVDQLGCLLDHAKALLRGEIGDHPIRQIGAPSTPHLAARQGWTGVMNYRPALWLENAPELAEVTARVQGIHV